MTRSRTAVGGHGDVAVTAGGRSAYVASTRPSALWLVDLRAGRAHVIRGIDGGRSQRPRRPLTHVAIVGAMMSPALRSALTDDAGLRPLPEEAVRLLGILQAPPRLAFLTLDEVLTGVTAGADHRLALQNAYPVT